jgi:hypothetical protein
MTNKTELPDLDRLRQIGGLITTQDNRITEAPIFVVEQQTPIISDSDYNDCRVEWRETENGDYQLASPERAERLDALHRAGRETPGWRRYEVADVWTFVTACFTEQGCIDYLARNGHNLRETRIYTYGSYRNEEFRAVRDSLIALARRAQPEGEESQADLGDKWHSLTCDGTCSPPCKDAPAAQQAESGAQAISMDLYEVIEAAIDAHYPKMDSPHASVNERIAAARLNFRKGYKAALAAQSQSAQAVRPECQAEPGAWSECQTRTIELYTTLQGPRAAAKRAQQAAAPAGDKNG